VSVNKHSSLSSFMTQKRCSINQQQGNHDEGGRHWCCCSFDAAPQTGFLSVRCRAETFAAWALIYLMQKVSRTSKLVVDGGHLPLQGVRLAQRVQEKLREAVQRAVQRLGLAVELVVGQLLRLMKRPLPLYVNEVDAQV